MVDPKTIPFLISQGVPRKLLPVGTFLLGIILAFLWAYVISPNVYTAAEPVHLGESWKREWVKQAAWQYEAASSVYSPVDNANNVTLQLGYLGNAPEIVQKEIEHLQGTAPGGPELALVQAIQPFAATNQEQLNKITPTLFNSNLTPLLCLIVPALLFGGLVIFNTIIPISVLLQRRSSAPSTVTEGVHAEQIKAREEAKKKAAEAPAAPAPAVAALGNPVGRYMSTYIMGDDMYDDSFSIETPSNEFLGETGAGISKTIGVGEPKKVTAIEVWVFDKNDIRTVTKVLMSEHAFTDEAIRAELAPKGEAVPVRAGDTVMLETQTLTVQARIIDLAYGTGALPPNSFFERLSVEISAWPKKSSDTGVTSAIPQPPAMPPAFDDTAPMK
ncbi:MAG: hypothetical protein IT323_01435 [Anaerolineae bacterium]|nr:hypothetical protein [Anaerolineae bacterium]